MPGRIVLKNQPRLRLVDVLRRRRSTLAILVGELGLSTYSGLALWCRRMGIVPPDEAQFVAAFPAANRVNSPQEGVVVLEPPVVIAEHTGSPVELEASHVDTEAGPEPPTGAPEASQKKRRPKKDDPPPSCQDDLTPPRL